METNIQNALLINNATLQDLEVMVTRTVERILEEKLQNVASLKADSPKDGLYKRVKAAEMLQISLPTLDCWTKAGLIEGRRIGRSIFYTEADLNKALKKLVR